MENTTDYCELFNFTEDDFKVWLKRNRDILKDSSPDEIASLAHFCYFKMSVVTSVLSHFKDAMQGSNFDNRSKMHINCEVLAIERHQGKISLKPQWFDLYKKIEYGLDYDD